MIFFFNRIVQNPRVIPLFLLGMPALSVSITDKPTMHMADTQAHAQHWASDPPSREAWVHDSQNTDSCSFSFFWQRQGQAH